MAGGGRCGPAPSAQQRLGRSVRQRLHFRGAAISQRPRLRQHGRPLGRCARGASHKSAAKEAAGPRGDADRRRRTRAEREGGGAGAAVAALMATPDVDEG